MINEIKEITKIRLLYENNEVISIPVEHINVLYMAGFNKVTGLIEDNQLYWMTTINTLTLKINETINATDIGLSYDDMLSPEELEVPLTERIKERIDLVAVRLYGSKAEEEELVYLEWDNENLYYNTKLTNKMTDDSGVSIKLETNK